MAKNAQAHAAQMQQMKSACGAGEIVIAQHVLLLQPGIAYHGTAHMHTQLSQTAHVAAI
jgi:hypothetical protein